MKVTWLTPYWDDWVARFGGKPAGGQMAKVLKPLHDEHGVDVVRPAWRRYLTDTSAAYASVVRFGQTFGSWTGAKPQALGRGDKSWIDAKEWTQE